MPSKNDPEAYRKASEPFESEEAYQQALDQFFERVYELRTELGIPDVYMVTTAFIQEDDGGEGQMASSFHIGDISKALPMIAWAYGKEQKVQEQTLRRLVRGE